ncbi:tetraacyldisaccharide 4'-kinase [candidate division LCP-89 bacterium B3_LCP]|uniref:Tetraacyldisaccharide 4'-kinase n=1 Tax=candidate division LCP-89 bacterium B3_LCP TaxID=2012998 RepID=A0A532V5N2_UNCL8|nr:MAG: tetraacyldisaccharide 4'-kinase [candidate division LCP-89 bacterium B3_LCP]
MKLELFWNKISPLLIPFSWLYGIAVRFRNAAYERGLFRTERLNVPVISIGNLSVGGTGKTPVTLKIAQLLKGSPFNQKPAILSRGYGRKTKEYTLVSGGEDVLCDATESGDECQIYARRLPGIPVAVDADRVSGGRRLTESFDISLLLLDDAFQHRRIYRDLDIVLIDSRYPIWNEKLLPAGTLREYSPALERAHLIVLTNFQPEDKENSTLLNNCIERFGQESVATCRPCFHRSYLFRTGEEVSSEEISGSGMIGFCGIAKPQGFQSMLEGLGIDVLTIIHFSDHHNYKPSDVEKLATVLNRAQADYLVTTEKDAVKLGPLFQALPVLVIEIDIEWLEGFDYLQQKLLDISKVNS